MFNRDDHYYRIQSERSQIFSEKETLEKVYAALLEEHRALQTAHDDALAEREEAKIQLRQVQREAGTRRSEKADGMVRVEIDRLRGELWVPPLRAHAPDTNDIVGRKARRTLHWPRLS